MHKPKIQKILEEYFTGNLSPELDEVIQGWIAGEINNPESKHVFEQFFYRFISSQEPSPEAYERLKKLHKILKIGEEEKKSNPFYRRPFFRMAAALIPVAMIIAGTYLYITDSKDGDYDPVPDTPLVADIQVTVPAGEYKQLLLADGTEVTLNSGSRFVYDDQRNCSLQGEGFFKVAKSDTPFIITTSDIKVTVLGTEFNVRAYEDEAATRVALYSGMVNLNNDNIDYRLAPHQEFTYNRDSRMVEVVDIDSTIAAPGWLDTVMNFEGRTLAEILASVESYYSVSIEYDSRLNTVQLYSFDFTGNETIDEVMTVLQTISGEFTYRIEQNKIILETIN